MYAVVRFQAGGKQVRVQTGDVVVVDRLEASPGDQITLDQVLLLGGEGSLKVGAPLVSGAVVKATVQGETKGPKIHIFKYHRRKRYRLRKGHRQQYTALRIDAIEV
jgi:large subunit ribosomal protein L21